MAQSAWHSAGLHLQMQLLRDGNGSLLLTCARCQGYSLMVVRLCLH